VLIVAFPGLQTLDAVGPYEVFAGANQVIGKAAYDVGLYSLIGGRRR
jgi:hypothetical protein